MDFLKRPPAVDRALVVMAALIVIGAAAASRASEPEGPCLLRLSHWSASAFSHHAEGRLCWIVGEDGSLRLEVLSLASGGPGHDIPGYPGGTAELAPLLEQDGEGWTLILGPDGQGTLNAWGREWRLAERGLRDLATAALVDLASGPETAAAGSRLPNPPRPRFLRAAAAGGRLRPGREIEIAALDDEGAAAGPAVALRGRLVKRGRGQGAKDEVVSLRWHESSEGSAYLRIRSSRRPGSLAVGSPRSFPIVDPPAELFLPLWPLSDLVEFPGTRSRPGG